MLGKGLVLEGMAGCWGGEINLAQEKHPGCVGGVQRTRTCPPQGGFGEVALRPGSVALKGWHLARKPEGAGCGSVPGQACLVP